MMLLAPMTLALYMQSKQNEIAQCEEPDRICIIRGRYENKIRFFSPPEKSFEIFASEKQEDGELRMSYKDFLIAMTPFCYTPFFEGCDEYLKENTPSILKKVDADGDGSISFTEYFFFLVLLQIHPRKLKRVFSKFEGGKLKKSEGGKCLRELRLSTQAGQK